MAALVAGALTGVAGGLFRLALSWADQTRLAVLAYSHHHYPYLGWLIPVLGAALCVGLARFLVRFQPLAGGSGVQHVEAVMRDEDEPAPFGVVPVKFVGGILSTGAGMALSREGPTVQMGSIIGSRCGRWLGLPDEDVRSLQAATAGAGLGVAFNAPLGGSLFAFEEVAHVFNLRLVLATLVACGTAMAVVQQVLGNPIDFHVAPLSIPGFWTLAPYLVLGVLLGALSVAYNRLIVTGLDVFESFTAVPVGLRAALVGAVVGTIAWFEPRLVGGGEALGQTMLTGGLPLTTVAVVFVVRAPFTGIVLVVELTATTSLLVPMLIAGFGAMLAATLLVDNPAHRYIVRPGTPGLTYGSDGSLAAAIQADKPAGVPEANWLPAPMGAFNVALRTYQPQEAIVQGKWFPPAIVRMNQEG